MLTYSRTASGAAPTLRTIASSPAIGDLSQVTVDAASGELVVANHARGAIRMWPVATNGTVNALRSIVGAATQLSSPRGVAVCPGSREYVAANANGDSVTFHAPTANGDIAPVRVVAGAATLLDSPRFVAITGACVTAAGPAAATAVPALGPLALLLLAAGLGVFGARRLRQPTV